MGAARRGKRRDTPGGGNDKEKMKHMGVFTKVKIRMYVYMITVMRSMTSSKLIFCELCLFV